MKPPIWETAYYKIPVYWMLISFMALDPEEQLKYFEYSPLHLGDKDYNMPTKNILMVLINALHLYSFNGEFDDDKNVCAKDEWFHDLLYKYRNDIIYSYESFINDAVWSEIRKGAKELLDTTEL